MTQQTRHILVSVLESDPSTASRIDAILDFAEHPEKFQNPPTKGRLLSGTEVAKMLNRTPQTIRNWVKAGVLTPAKAPNSDRSAGYFEADVEALKRQLTSCS